MEDDAEDPTVARPEFRNLEESEVWKAVAEDKEGDSNRISAEVTRLVAAYTSKYMACAEQHGRVPPHVLHVSVRHAIERVAVTILVNVIEAKAGVGPKDSVH